MRIGERDEDEVRGRDDSRAKPKSWNEVAQTLAVLEGGAGKPKRAEGHFFQSRQTESHTAQNDTRSNQGLPVVAVRGAALTL